LREYNRRSLLQGLATINHRLEYSEPYYDYDLVDFAMRVPVHLRWNRKIHKMALARLSPPLAHVPLGSPPKAVGLKREWRRGWRKLSRLGARLGIPWPGGLGRGSYAFTDRSYLLRTASREWVEDVLLSPRTLERGYFRSEAIRQIVTDHMTGRHNRSGQLGVLLTFELWHRCFIDGVPTSVTAAEEEGGTG
jgi:asparagine synthase (glutamine-hydrolysing)